MILPISKKGPGNGCWGGGVSFADAVPTTDQPLASIAAATVLRRSETFPSMREFRSQSPHIGMPPAGGLIGVLFSIFFIFIYFSLFYFILFYFILFFFAIFGIRSSRSVITTYLHESKSQIPNSIA